MEQLTLPMGSAHCVKLTAQESKIIHRASSKLGMSIPSLLREAFFNRPPTKVLMTRDEVSKLRKDINRIGNNINQIAREINSGIRHGWNKSFDGICEQLKMINRDYVLKYGIRQN